jgi:uncharacterized membrane protein YhiD involved in acid resistance
LSVYDAKVIATAGFWTDLGRATGPLALAALIFVLAVVFILSPAGRPAPPRRRAGGFSRAIADRTDGEGGAQ